MTAEETELLAEYALLEALIAEEKAQQALDRPHGRGATYLPKHRHTASDITGLTDDLNDDYVNVSGDTMTGDLSIPYDDGVGSVSGITLERVSPISGLPSVSFEYDDTGYGGSTDSTILIYNSVGTLTFMDQDSAALFSILTPLVTGGDPWMQFGGNWDSSITFSADSSYNIGLTAVRPATIFTDVLNLGSGAAGTHIVLRTDDQSDVGAVGKELRNLYVDGTAYIDSLRSDVELDIDGAITVDGIDIAGVGAGAFQRAIPVTYSGGAGYIYIYDSA